MKYPVIPEENRATVRNPLASRRGNKISGYLYQRRRGEKMTWEYGCNYGPTGSKKSYSAYVRSDLVEDVERAIVQIKPAIYIVENVLGKQRHPLTSSEKVVGS
ncbi:hypothetical protein ACE1AT_12615 [Pelatocladus sp. BLCC-F211]|uniref:hypothetical protein n=1 Tax=Pelatocladus sp. BLCC-F211 TaxID=3342752 RepID=UPI0035B79094